MSFILLDPAGTAVAANNAVAGFRTTAFTLTTAFVDITFDSTPVETEPAVIEHNNTNTDDFDIKVTGTYLLLAQHNILVITSVNSAITCDGRIRLNDTSVIVGSQASQGAFRDNAITGNVFPTAVGSSGVANLTAGDKLTYQLKKTILGGGDQQYNVDQLSFQVIRLK